MPAKSPTLCTSRAFLSKIHGYTRQNRVQWRLVKPGEELIVHGLADLAAGHEIVPSLLVSIGAPRLRRACLSVPDTIFENPEHRLYKLLASENGDVAHSKYNSIHQTTGKLRTRSRMRDLG